MKMKNRDRNGEKNRDREQQFFSIQAVFRYEFAFRDDLQESARIELEEAGKRKEKHS